ncbi:PREDICTED: uncharacterized protein LOC107191395 [Dufourea novaeangliae]|uniref:Uncharacterized protein n=1 Tax=Dufourea novaeangliae TaxID=178035 RepID=A0A154PNI1_DUFNO|nr:PREDICTED: uncharacterized protein LOC107191395 [Dufourea novaeangliae]KZC13287.1 hypothetical protein WN55_05593 [Dufourea novaeangliae]
MDNFSSPEASHSEKLLKHENAVHKRRSSIFQSRITVFDECEGNEKSLENHDTNKYVSKTPEVEGFNLELYIRNLKEERKEWIETLRQRKAERKSLKKQKLRLENQGKSVDLITLSDSEKAFVTSRPDYQSICKSNKRLTEMALKVSILHHMVYKLNQRFILRMEKKLCRVTKKVIETSES